MESDFDNLIYNKQPVVIDNGSGIIKAGFSGDEKPKLFFNNYVGRPKHNKVMLTTLDQDLFIGSECDKNKGLLKLTYNKIFKFVMLLFALFLAQNLYPMSHGNIDNWEEMEQVWGYVYKEMKVSASQHPVLISEVIDNPVSTREKIAEKFFEHMSVPALYFQSQPILSLYAQGKTTGIVVDIGDGISQCVPIVDGYAIKGTSSRIDVGGRDVTEYLMLLLRRMGYNFHTSAEFQIVKNMKEKLCTNALTPLKESDYKNVDEKNFQEYFLPDGSCIIAF